MRTFAWASVALSGSLIVAAPALDPLREGVIEQIFEALATERVACLGRVEDQGRSGVLFCAEADTSDLKQTQKRLHRTIMGQEGVDRADGPWLFQNQREFNRRIYETDNGPVELRIYYTRNLVAGYFPLADYSVDVEVVSCEQPRLAKLYEAIPDLEDRAGYEPPVQYARGPALYPESARGTGLRGRVGVKAVIRADGTVSDACVISAKPAGAGFEAPALAALLNCRFDPARLDGKPVDTVLSTRVDFRPESLRKP